MPSRSPADNRRRSRTICIALALVLALGAAAAALAAGAAAPKPGIYRGASGFRFAFSVKQASCRIPPPNLQNPKARAGRKKVGPCFMSIQTPPIKLTCPGTATTGGQVMLVSSFSGLLLVGGRLHTKAYSYTSDPEPVGYYELSITVSGGRASGFVRHAQTIYDANGAPVLCDSGKRPFTAVHA